MVVVVVSLTDVASFSGANEGVITCLRRDRREVGRVCMALVHVLLS